MSQKKAQLFNPLNGNINVTGVVTASSFSGDVTGTATTATSAQGLSGSPDITVTNVTGAAATFTGNVTIGGTLTYQDVENIDSVGIITAQQGIQVLANGLDITGVGTFKSNVSIADSVIHTGDTDTSIRFPAADTITAETGGSERIRVDSNGNVLFAKTVTDLDTAGSRVSSGFISLSGDSSSTNLAANAGGALSLANVDTTDGNFSNIGGYNSNGLVVNQINLINTSHSSRTGDITFSTHNGTSLLEAARFDSSQRLLIGTSSAVTAPNDKVQINSSTGVGIHRGEAGAAGPRIDLTKSRNATHGSNTIVQSGDLLGSIFFRGDDGTDYNSSGAQIYAQVDGTPGANDMPGRLVLATSADGSASPTERLRITSTGGVHFNNAELIERVNVTSGKLSDNTNINLENGMMHLFTTTETTTATPNIMTNTGINTHMAVGDAMSVTIVTTAAAAGYAATVHIDGVTVGTNGGTLNWTGGSAPSDGGSSGVDIYAYTIMKTASATYTVIATQTKTS